MPLAHESMEEGRGSVGEGEGRGLETENYMTIIDVPIEASRDHWEKSHKHQNQ